MNSSKRRRTREVKAIGRVEPEPPARRQKRSRDGRHRFGSGLGADQLSAALALQIPRRRRRRRRRLAPRRPERAEPEELHVRLGLRVVMVHHDGHCSHVADCDSPVTQLRVSQSVTLEFSLSLSGFCFSFFLFWSSEAEDHDGETNISDFRGVRQRTTVFYTCYSWIRVTLLLVSKISVSVRTVTWRCFFPFLPFWDHLRCRLRSLKINYFPTNSFAAVIRCIWFMVSSVSTHMFRIYID